MSTKKRDILRNGTVYIMEDIVRGIKKDYCQFDYGTVKVRIYLPNEVLANFTPGKTKIKVVGELANIITEPIISNGATVNCTTFVFQNGYFLEEVEY